MTHRTCLKTACAMALAAAITSAPPAFAKGNDWETMGERTLVPKLSTVKLNIGREVGQLRRLRITVIAGPLVLRDVRVTFSNALTRDFLADRRKPLSPGETFDVTFPPGGTFVARIAIEGRALREAGDFAQIRVAADTTENVSFNDGLEVIETTEYGPGQDTIAFAVGKEEGQFETLSVRAPDRSLRMRALQVTYEDGSKTEIALEQDILGLQNTREVTIDATRPIRSVSAIIHPRQRGNLARLQLVGRAASD